MVFLKGVGKLINYFQFGIVHYFTKVGSGEYYLEELENEPCPKVILEFAKKAKKQFFVISSSFDVNHFWTFGYNFISISF